MAALVSNPPDMARHNFPTLPPFPNLPSPAYQSQVQPKLASSVNQAQPSRHRDEHSQLLPPPFRMPLPSAVPEPRRSTSISIQSLLQSEPSSPQSARHNASPRSSYHTSPRSVRSPLDLSLDSSPRSFSRRTSLEQVYPTTSQRTPFPYQQHAAELKRSRQYLQREAGVSPASSSTSSAFRPIERAQTHVSMDSPHAQHDPESRYRLIIRQQPIAARACGYGERDRRVIDPPPIVQLQLTDFDCNDPSDMEQLTFPWNIIHCTLWTAGDANTPPVEVTNVLDPNGSYKEHKRLMGTMIANAFLGLDPNVPMSEPADARRAAFYIFGDLSCRQNGTYRLKFSCASVNPIAVHNLESTTHTFQATAMSDIFEVFSAKDFPGMRASTPLTRELKRQGAPIQVKKGNEGKTEKKSQTKIDNDSDSADSSGEERTGGESSSYAGRKRKKRS